MANNNARRGARADTSGGAPRWVIFMGGFTSGVITTVIVGALLWPRPTAIGGAADDADEQKPTPAKPAIEYTYEGVLSDAEVPIAADIRPQSAAAPVLTGPDRTLLQVASFRTAGDAESLRAQLLLLDLGPVSTREGLVNGELWYRVLVGPFPSEAAKRSAADKLRAQNLQVLQFAAPADVPNESPPNPGRGNAEPAP